MSDESALDVADPVTTPRRGQLSANGHWIFGSLYAVLALIGFSVGIWAGAQKPKPPEVAETKKDETDKPASKPEPKQPVVTPPPLQPMPQPQPEPKPEPKTEPKPKEPDPKPKQPPVTATPPKSEIKPVAFKEVVPILRTYCFKCHGDVGKPKAGIDLRTVAAIKKGDEGGKPVVVPGNPEKSPLYESITSGRMPDNGAKGPDPTELKLLHDWIASGAKERRRVIRRRKSKCPDSHLKVELTPKPDGG